MSEILKELQAHLPREIGASVRYAGHSSMLKLRGYKKLGDKYAEEAAEEAGHAQQVMWRIQELGAIPAYTASIAGHPCKEWDICELLMSDLEIEQSVMASLIECNDCAEHESDYASSELLRKLIRETQEHITWLRTQCAQVKELGVENYLQAQL